MRIPFLFGVAHRFEPIGIGTHDGMGCPDEDSAWMGSTPNDLPGILPSNQCEEVWHRIIKKLVKLRASTYTLLLRCRFDLPEGGNPGGDKQGVLS